ncbi:MAG: hypothetical protein R2839_10315 [Thermomicrobiales bacterium]
MSTTEWFLLAMVIIVPLIIATGVTLWTLEQALKRNKKYRQAQEAAKAEKQRAKQTGRELGS